MVAGVRTNRATGNPAGDSSTEAFLGIRKNPYEHAARNYPEDSELETDTEDRFEPEPLGDFQLLERIGGGSMGDVFLARQVSLDRGVAVKVLRPHLTRTSALVERFKREALAAAKLNHVGIVPIHAVGRQGDTYFFAMDFIAGHNLSTELKLQRGKRPRTQHPALLPRFGSPRYIPTIVRLCAQVADALAHGHEHGIVHRDVKPGNILLDLTEEPHLVDFGLAKDQSQESISHSGDLQGTPHYMSPEQTLAKRVRLDHRTDIFSLGVVLYELLTLAKPFDGASCNEILYEISFREPRRIRRIDPRIPRDLETICCRALSKCPTERYPTAREFADDLRRFLRHEAIHARPWTLLDHMRCAAQTHRFRLAMAAIGLVLVAVGLALVAARDEKTQRARTRLLTQLGVPRISVTGSAGAQVWALELDQVTGQPRSRLPLGTTPVLDQVIEGTPGTYLILVETTDGHAELLRHLSSGENEEFEAIVCPTAQVVGAGMVRIPAGPFAFQSGDRLALDASRLCEPFHLPAFWIDGAEVSNREYLEFVSATGHRWPRLFDSRSYRAEWGELPVVGITILEARAYAEWAGKRLPTHPEWERAARGPAGCLYPWSDEPSHRSAAPPPAPTFLPTGNADLDLYLRNVRPVRSHPETINAQGLFHVLDNVREYTASEYFAVSEDEPFFYGPFRIVKGSAWGASGATLGEHAGMPVFESASNTGFRCAKSERP